MKKTLICLAVAFMAMTSANAQKKLADLNILNHLAVGLDVGTTGIGADIAVPCTKYLEIQAGISIMPKIKYNTTLHFNNLNYIDDNNINKVVPGAADLKDIPVQGKLNMINGNVLFNIYPIPLKSFHITVGAFFGNSDIVEVYNAQKGQLMAVNTANDEIDKYNENYAYPGNPNDLQPQSRIGLKLDDYLLTPDAEGNAKASLKVKSFKPYVGIGIGRAVPKRRLNFKCDLGAMFWGSPDIVDHNGHSLLSGIGSNDGGAVRIIRKIKVYPVLNFRLAGRIF